MKVNVEVERAKLEAGSTKKIEAQWNCLIQLTSLARFTWFSRVVPASWGRQVKTCVNVCKCVLWLWLSFCGKLQLSRSTTCKFGKLLLFCYSNSLLPPFKSIGRRSTFKCIFGLNKTRSTQLPSVSFHFSLQLRRSLLVIHFLNLVFTTSRFSD